MHFEYETSLMTVRKLTGVPPPLLGPQCLLQFSSEAPLTLYRELYLWPSVGVNGAAVYSNLETGKLLSYSFPSFLL